MGIINASQSLPFSPNMDLTWFNDCIRSISLGYCQTLILHSTIIANWVLCSEGTNLRVFSKTSELDLLLHRGFFHPTPALLIKTYLASVSPVLIWSTVKMLLPSIVLRMTFFYHLLLMYFYTCEKFWLVVCCYHWNQLVLFIQEECWIKMIVPGCMTSGKVCWNYLPSWKNYQSEWTTKQRRRSNTHSVFYYGSQYD